MAIKKTRKKIIMTCIILLMALVSASFVCSLGVSPAKKAITFAPNKTVEFSFNIINAEFNSFDVELSSSGEISEMVFFENKIISLSSSKYKVPAKAMFKFPDQMRPGLHKGFLSITPIMKDETEKMFRAYISPSLPVEIRVPRERKYAEIGLGVVDVDEGTPVPVYLEFDNMGSKNITNAGGAIRFYNPNNVLLADMKAEGISIKAGIMKKTQALPAPILRRGEYTAKIDAYYDDVLISFNETFKIGNPKVKIERLITKKLSPNEINKVEFIAENDWNKELNVKGFIELGNNKEEMPDFKLQPGEPLEVTGFIDTAGAAFGNYNLSITLAYGNIIETHIFLVEVASLPLKPLKASWVLSTAVIAVILAITLLIVTIIIRKKSKL